ncbi:hypothetical protein ACWEQA_18810, partial [Nocardia sp. NPDC004085]
TVRVWDLGTGELRATLTGHTGPVSAVACANVDDTPIAITTSVDKTARVWDLNTMDLITVFDYLSPISTIAIGPAHAIVLGVGADVIALAPRRQPEVSSADSDRNRPGNEFGGISRR